MIRSLLKMLVSILAMLGLGVATLAHASGPCMPQNQFQQISPLALSDCAQGFFRTERGTVPCGKMRVGCIVAASCFSNVGLTVPEIQLPVHCRSDGNRGTVHIAVLIGIAFAPLLHPPATVS